jgi:hypothetical protein
MHGHINVKSPNNISKWQMGFNSAFKELIPRLIRDGFHFADYSVKNVRQQKVNCKALKRSDRCLILGFKIPRCQVDLETKF